VPIRCFNNKEIVIMMMMLRTVGNLIRNLMKLLQLESVTTCSVLLLFLLALHFSVSG
jgi:hypothetical protein